jgi:general secretion pathway protein H
MTSKPKACSASSPARAWVATTMTRLSSKPSPIRAGFTLLEMIVVVAVLGLALGLVVTRGPMRSPKLDMQSAVNGVTQGLRLARSRAIATNRPVRFAIDIPRHSFGVENETPTLLPKSVSIAMVTASEETRANRLAAIRFNGDGSATGGRIELADGQRTAQVNVEWLTGRVSVVQAR